MCLCWFGSSFACKFCLYLGLRVSRIRCGGELAEWGMLLLRMLCIFSWLCANILPALDSEVSACKTCRCRCMFSRRGYFRRVLAWGLRWGRLSGRLLQVELWNHDLWAQQRWWRILERILRGVLRGEGVWVFRTRGWSGRRLSMSWGRCSARWDTPDLKVLEGEK